VQRQEDWVNGQECAVGEGDGKETTSARQPAGGEVQRGREGLRVFRREQLRKYPVTVVGQTSCEHGDGVAEDEAPKGDEERD
jgi:hypothetical protein